MIPRDLMDVLWFVIDVLRDLCLWIVYGLFIDNSSTKSLKHLALRFAPSGRWGARMER
jgi:hypothetical protein